MTKKKIIIIDDEQSVLFLSKAILAAAGYEVLTESDSTKAYQAIAEQKPDLILLDIVMPEINGIELAKKIKDNPALKHIHLFALTGMPVLNEKNRIYFEKIILKPYQTETLLADIQALFAGRK
ncbi:MAG: response regulator [Candidatus Margulisbacteria bacterium]|jgi:twitching motility two-component system response regulator PilG|nr:response regulator [Candidatus Margulisiibacteriota bacterium]